MNDWVIIIVVYAAVFLSGPLIAILHEMGHALAYLILTRPPRVDIYIGTYRFPEKAISFRIGKLNFFIKRSFPFVKGIGLCRSYKPETNYLNYIVILLAGPVFTFVSAAVIGLIAFNSDASLLVKICCYVLLGFSVLSLITNLVPDKIGGKFYNNLDTDDIDLDNDGLKILFTLKIKNKLPAYIAALQYIDKNDLEAAMAELDKVLEKAPDAEKILRLQVTLAMNLKQYENAAAYLNRLESKHQLNKSDILQKGILQSLNKQHDEAIASYSRVLKMDRKNLVALNNIGCELIEKGAHEVAARGLERAIKINPQFDQPYGNLAYSKILQDKLEEGKHMADQCLSLNPKNADAYKTLGIYYLKQKNSNLATINFNKAVELDGSIDLAAYTEELKTLNP